MADELIDIFDSDYNCLDRQEMKKQAHKNGLWHRVFTGVLVNQKLKTLYLQKKTPGRYSFERPDYLDISVGGHYKAGESVADGVREVKEELGLDVKFSALIPLGIRQTSADIAEDYHNNEFQHLFIIPTDKDLPDFAFDGAEVNGLVSIPVAEGLDLIRGTVKELSVQGVFAVGGMKPLVISVDDFVPAYLGKDQLMERLFVAALRFCRGENASLLFW
ncbi:putative Nudix hydrolase [Alphaproteobacteria bacterium]|nr:putative Nudix hydrolase [Alphaproteobacteria bacterium]